MWFDESVKPASAAMHKAIAGAGYHPVRLDQVEHNNKIDDEIIATIRRSKFLVADLTGHRGGVYFEAGFALGLGLPVIWLCREDDIQQVHFDNRQYNFITWRLNELDDLERRLRNRIEATLGHGPFAEGGKARAD
jgi:nucleoside 2-deoxyribosyltransferase